MNNNGQTPAEIIPTEELITTPEKPVDTPLSEEQIKEIEDQIKVKKAELKELEDKLPKKPFWKFWGGKTRSGKNLRGKTRSGKTRRGKNLDGKTRGGKTRRAKK